MRGSPALDAETRRPRGSPAAWRAAAISAFDGTQPVFRQSPPILPRSTSTTETPNVAAAAATVRPAEPAPITQMSGVRTSLMPAGSRTARPVALLRAATGARLPATSAMTPSSASADEELDRHMRAVAVERRAEPLPEIGEHEGRRHDADRRRGNIGEKPHAEQRRGEIDEPEGKERHEAQEEQVAEPLLLEALREASARAARRARREARRARCGRSGRSASRRSSRRSRRAPCRGRAPKRKPPAMVRMLGAGERDGDHRRRRRRHRRRRRGPRARRRSERGCRW